MPLMPPDYLYYLGFLGARMAAGGFIAVYFERRAARRDRENRRGASS